MSLFHRIPSINIVRQEALEKAEQYFEDAELNISSLSLISIFQPDIHPLKGFPRTNCVKTCFEVALEDCSVIRDTESISDCATECCLSICLYSYMIITCWCSIGFFIDMSLLNDIPSRLDFFRLTLLVYNEGVFVYRRKMDTYNCSCCCLLLKNLDDDYTVHEEEFAFVSWEEVYFPRSPLVMGGHSESSEFVSFTIGGIQVNTRRHVFQELRKYEKEFIEANNAL
eukprot:snap_masked-scaffold_56-processed-gene-0.25-mRNA-1 protein AED:1.00 eAED:1.00 QI:0/-1/0/0/-1/1/1/0/225